MNKKNINILKLKYSLGIIISSIILILILLFSFMSISKENKKIKAYDNTSYDFLLTNLSKEGRLDEIKTDDNVISTTSFYDFRLKVQGSDEADFLFTEDIENIDKTFYSKESLIKGEYKENTAIVDEKFSKTFNLKVGDTIDFTILGQKNSIEISSIIFSTDLGGFKNGVVLLEWTDSLEALLTDELDHDLMFINVSNQDKLRTYLESNRMSYIERVDELATVKSLSEPLIKKTFINIIIYSVVLIVAKSVLVLGLFISDSNKIKVFVKEKNEEVISVYRFFGLKSEFLSFIILLIATTMFNLLFFTKQVFIPTLILVALFALVSAGIYYLISYKFTGELKFTNNIETVEEEVEEEQEKEEETKVESKKTTTTNNKKTNAK